MVRLSFNRCVLLSVVVVVWSCCCCCRRRYHYKQPILDGSDHGPLLDTTSTYSTYVGWEQDFCNIALTDSLANTTYISVTITPTGSCFIWVWAWLLLGVYVLFRCISRITTIMLFNAIEEPWIRIHPHVYTIYFIILKIYIVTLHCALLYCRCCLW